MMRGRSGGQLLGKALGGLAVQRACGWIRSCVQQQPRDGQAFLVVAQGGMHQRAVSSFVGDVHVRASLDEGLHAGDRALLDEPQQECGT